MVPQILFEGVEKGITFISMIRKVFGAYRRRLGSSEGSSEDSSELSSEDSSSSSEEDSTALLSSEADSTSDELSVSSSEEDSDDSATGAFLFFDFGGIIFKFVW